MSYRLNKTDGTLLIDLIDGVIDTDSTDLTLVGKNYTGYGESFNENFIKLLENFANPNSPVSPLRGQLWYDTSTAKLKVFNGELFETAAGSYVTDEFPTNPSIGDTWLKLSTQQYYVYTGNLDDAFTEEASSGWTLIGPEYTLLQRRTGFLTDSVLDETNRARTIMRIVIGGTTVGIVSSLEFTPNINERSKVQGLVTAGNPTGRVYKGFNLYEPTEFVYRGTASQALALESSTGEEITVNDLVRKDGVNETMTGSLAIRNSAGLTIGASQNLKLLIDNGTVLQNTRQDEDFRIKINSSASQLSETEAFTLKSASQRIGLFQSNPQYTLDVAGDTRISGNLFVEGDTVSVDVSTLHVEDKNIELGRNQDGIVFDDAGASGGGITLKSTVTDKTFNWLNTTGSWTSSEHIDLAAGKDYKINGTTVLSASELGSSVTQALGLTRVGTLTELTVDNIQINNNAITRINGSGISIDAGLSPTVDFNNARLQNVDTPTADAEGANKVYVDQTIQTEPIVFSMDVTGWTNPDIVNAELINILNTTYPPSTFGNGKEARIPIFWYNTQTVSGIDVAGNTTTPTTSVMSFPSGTAVTVLQSVGLPNNLSATFDPTVQRDVRIFEIASGVWQLKP